MTSSPGSHVARSARSSASRRPDRDQDLGRRVVADAVAALQVVGERACAARACRGCSCSGCGPRAAISTPASTIDPRRVEVGLPHPEADDVVHRRGDVEEAPDARRRHGQDALGEDALGERRSGGHGRAVDIAASRSAGVGRRGIGGGGQLGRLQAPPVGVGRDAPRSRARARTAPASDHGAPMSCSPTGSPSDSPARDRDAGQAGHVDRQRAGIREVHRRPGRPAAPRTGRRPSATSARRARRSPAPRARRSRP